MHSNKRSHASKDTAAQMTKDFHVTTLCTKTGKNKHCLSSHSRRWIASFSHINFFPPKLGILVQYILVLVWWCQTWTSTIFWRFEFRLSDQCASRLLSVSICQSQYTLQVLWSCFCVARWMLAMDTRCSMPRRWDSGVCTTAPTFFGMQFFTPCRTWRHSLSFSSVGVSNGSMWQHCRECRLNRRWDSQQYPHAAG